MGLTGIVAAMSAEGAVFRKAWGLKALDIKGPFRCFGDGTRILVISGVGSLKCAAAVAWLLTRYPEIQKGVLINVGAAGSEALKTGSVHIIHQAVDRATGRHLYPDILFSHPYGEATLHTVDKPLSAPTTGIGSGDLVDMEGAAFLQAAALWMPCHRVHMIKVVSDNLSPEKVDKGGIMRLMAHAVPAVEHVMQAAPEDGAHKDIDERMGVFGEIGERWRLTVTQRAQLDRAGRAWLLRHPDQIYASPGDIETPRDKQRRARALGLLLDRLWEE